MTTGFMLTTVDVRIGGTYEGNGEYAVNPEDKYQIYINAWCELTREHYVGWAVPHPTAGFERTHTRLKRHRKVLKKAHRTSSNKLSVGFFD